MQPDLRWAFIKLLSRYKEVHAYQKVMEMFAIMNYLMKHPMSFTYPNSFLERHNVDSEFCQREVAWLANVKYSAFTSCMQPKTSLSPFQWLCLGNQIASKMIFIQRLKLLYHLWQLRSGFQVCKNWILVLCWYICHSRFVVRDVLLT